MWRDRWLVLGVIGAALTGLPLAEAFKRLRPS